jgi:hypothetical protein
MVNKKEFPYCRRCQKSRLDPETWAKTTIKGTPRKLSCCGECGHVLAWHIRKAQNKIKRTSVPNNVKQNLMTSKDIKNNMAHWKKWLSTSEKKK